MGEGEIGRTVEGIGGGEDNKQGGNEVGTREEKTKLLYHEKREIKLLSHLNQ